MIKEDGSRESTDTERSSVAQWQKIAVCPPPRLKWVLGFDSQSAPAIAVFRRATTRFECLCTVGNQPMAFKPSHWMHLPAEPDVDRTVIPPLS